MIDLQHKRIGVERFLALSVDLASDLARMRSYYADQVGRHPHQQASAIAFRAPAP